MRRAPAFTIALIGTGDHVLAIEGIESFMLRNIPKGYHVSSTCVKNGETVYKLERTKK